MQYTGTGVAFSLFGIEVRWYGIFIVTGMILAMFLSAKEAKRRGLKEDDVFDLAFWAIPIAVIGARLWYVIFEWSSYQGDVSKIINIREGGLAIQGGLMAAMITGWIFCKVRKLSFLEMADIIFPYVVMAQGIGRWGNFTNNEAFGTPTNLPWALIVNGQSVHPTFLYESIGDIVICLTLIWITRKKLKFNGQILMLYFILYGILRFFVEGLRTDSLYYGNIRVAQLLAICGIVIGIAGLVYLSKKNKEKLENK